MKLCEIQTKLNEIINRLYEQEGDVDIEEIRLYKHDNGGYEVRLILFKEDTEADSHGRAEFKRDNEGKLCGIAVYFD